MAQDDDKGAGKKASDKKSTEAKPAKKEDGKAKAESS